ncbi:MAG: hypothetical protein HYU44_04325 [Betaproteobacteria bacterium]|nr:hypothetical protein [Betaproteobacteria bacterium]
MTQPKNPRGFASQQLPQKRLRIAKEVRSIQHRAAEHDVRIVSVGPLVLFSTQTGDAWILDPADQLAARLAYDGDPLALYIEETETNYAIGWQGRYRIDNGTFVYQDNQTHRLIAIRGYPTQLLLHTISKPDRH